MAASGMELAVSGGLLVAFKISHAKVKNDNYRSGQRPKQLNYAL